MSSSFVHLCKCCGKSRAYAHTVMIDGKTRIVVECRVCDRVKCQSCQRYVVNQFAKVCACGAPLIPRMEQK